MKITADLVTRAGQFLNPLMDRELDLRAYKIPAIENLGATKVRSAWQLQQTPRRTLPHPTTPQDGYDCIDLSDNDIVRLENFPLLKRLKMVLLSNNRISRVADGLGAALPSLDTLVLTNNRIATLAEIDGLADLTALRTLSLLQNPVNRRAHYRLYVIHKLPNLRVLDFQKIREKEREAASALFASTEGRKLTAAVNKARTYTPSAVAAADAGGEGPFTPAQVVLLQEAVAAASTPEEVDRLHRYLKAGKLPPEVARKEAEAAPAAPAAAAGGGGEVAPGEDADGDTDMS